MVENEKNNIIDEENIQIKPEVSIKKLNSQGLKLLEYKKECLKDYSPIVIEGLLLGLQKMLDTSLINQQTYEILTNNSITLEDTKSYLIELPDFVKSKEEAIQEYNLYKTRLYKKMLERNIIINKNLYKLEIDENCDTIDLIKTFTIDSNFAKQYFNVVTEKELTKLMKPKTGFIEKFAALRLAAIAEGFVEENKDFDKDKLTILCDKPFREEDGLGYSIEFVIKINPFFLEKEGKFEQTIIALEHLIKLIDIYVEERTVI